MAALCLHNNMKFKMWIEAEQQWQRFGHQKSFPFMREPDNPFMRKASPFLGNDVEDMGLDDSQYNPENMYHVTTNLPAVKASGLLKSRSQLGGQGIGLGGGPSNMAPNMISLTYNYGKAKEIYDGLQFVADVVSGRMPASSIYDYVMSHHDDRYDDMDGQLSNSDRVIAQYVPKRFILDGDEAQIKAYLDRKILTPEDRYAFLQELETAVIEDNPIPDYSDTMEFDRTIGFTAPFEKIMGLRRENVAIIQVVVRRDADTSHYSQEAELRVLPQDVAIVRYLQP